MIPLPLLVVLIGGGVAALAMAGGGGAGAAGETLLESGTVQRDGVGYRWELREYRGRYGGFWFDPQRDQWRAFGIGIDPWWAPHEKDRLRTNFLEMLQTWPVPDFGGIDGWPIRDGG